MKCAMARLCLPLLLALLCRPAGAKPVEPDDTLAAARRYVQGSDRYMHHSRLGRGMKGYGLTVMAGVKIVKFQAEILSVMTDWGPHQDIILARLSGKDLDGVDLQQSGVVAGMSGSPVYVTDPVDGKDKMIGAVAMSWEAQKEPLCGIQPITQMIAVGGFLPGARKAAADGGKPVAARPMQAPRGYLSAVLDPRKSDFSALFAPQRRQLVSNQAGGRLTPLATPLMMSGASRTTIAEARRVLGPLGIVPLQAGTATAAQAQAAADAKLQPGAAMALALVKGDADFSAVCTVTDVMDGRVLAFGHGMFSEGDIAMPIGPAYVHTVVSSLLTSFKLGSTLKITGTADRDEHVGVCGRVGEQAPMVPMNVTVKWTGENRTQRYHFEICRHRWFTVVLARTLIMGVASGWSDLPEQNTVVYAVDVDFGELGRYRAANTTSQEDVSGVVSDVSRPLAALLNNPFGRPPEVRRIDVNIQIEPVNRRADILDLKLDGKVYRPGETVKGTLTVRGYRQPRKSLPVCFELPADLAEGAYTLTASDSVSAMMAQQSEMPHRFDPRTVEELFAVLQRVVGASATKVYLHLRLPGGGVALDQRELGDLPPSKAMIISEAAQPDTRAFERSVVRETQTDYVIAGSASAEFTVKQQPKETLIRQQGENK